MANANTEHSRKLRSKTATEYNRQKIEAGEIRVISLKLKTELLDEFDELCSMLGLSRPALLSFLIDHYNKTK